MSKQEIGRLGEKEACDFLKKKGYLIKETNFRCPYGEIDIIAQQRDTLVFIEVRTKTNGAYGSPEESVTNCKKEKLVTTALVYLNTLSKTIESWRIDFIAVELDQERKMKRIELIENAIC